MELFPLDKSGISGPQQDSQHQDSGPGMDLSLLHSGTIMTCANPVVYVMQ